MYKKRISKPEPRKRDTKRGGERGDHTTKRLSPLPQITVDSEFQAEHLDGYLSGKNLGTYLTRVQEHIGGTGDTGKQLMAKRQEEAAMKRIALAKLMLQANPQYGVRLSEKNLRKIEAKMLKDTKPLDINKRRMLYQMYTFRKPSEENKTNAIKEETLAQQESTEMESEIEEVLDIRTNEGVQTDISCSNISRADTPTLPVQVPVAVAKDNSRGNPADISNTPSQRNQTETANVPSQRIPVDMAKDTTTTKDTRKQTGISSPSAVRKLPIDPKKNPTLVSNLPSHNISVDLVKEPSLKKAEMAKVTSPSPVEMAKETWQRKQAEVLNPTQTPPTDIEQESLPRKQTQLGNQSVIRAYIANTTSHMSQGTPNSQQMLADMTNQWKRKRESDTLSPNTQKKLNVVGESLHKQAFSPNLPPRKRYTRIPQEQFSHRKQNDIAYSPTKRNDIPPAHTRQKKTDKPNSPVEKKQIDTPHSPLMKKHTVRQHLSPKKFTVQHPPVHKKYTPISTQKSLPTNHKRKPVIKTLTITQKGHSTKIYKAVSFVEQKKASLKINMEHKSERSRAASSSRSHKSKQLSTSQESTSSNHNSPKRVEKDDSPVEKENSPSSIAKLVANRRHKIKRRKRARSPDMEEAPLPQTEVAKWAPQSVNEHTKPYYEAWVNTTLTAVSSDNENVRREKERIMEIMRERLEACLNLSEEELSDEKYTGRIKVVTRR